MTFSIVQILPDSSSYLDFADMMLKSSDWFSKADLTDYQDPLHHRLPFYPLLIACGQFLFGKAAGLGFMIVLQFSLFAFTLQRFFSFMCKLDFTRMRAALTTLAFATAIPLFYACAILTDSFMASLGLLALISVTLCMLNKATGADLIILGLAFTFMALLSTVTIVFALSLIPFLIALFFMKQHQRLFIVMTLITLPLMIIYASISAWNYYRTDHPFVTTELTTALVSPLIDFKNEFPKLDYRTFLDGYLPFQKPYHLKDGLNAAEHLSLEQKIDMIQLEDLLMTSYADAWDQYPWQRFYLVLKNMDITQLMDVFNPVNTASLFLPKDKDFKADDQFMLVMSAVGLLSLALVLFGLYKLCLRLKSRREKIDWVYLCLGLQALLWWVMHSAIHAKPSAIMACYAVFALLSLSPGKKVLAGEKAK